MHDGRMYPPQMDHAYPVKDRPGFTRFRSKGHNTLIGQDGTIEIQDRVGGLIHAKPGCGSEQTKTSGEPGKD